MSAERVVLRWTIVHYTDAAFHAYVAACRRVSFRFGSLINRLSHYLGVSVDLLTSVLTRRGRFDMIAHYNIRRQDIV
ncbi:uncharacterized protein GLRG_05351 [Colletotrichum graminicola M1.001]|uniref:Uncharacterized protein n=1 Tax=Colletotrichum graminicola (strain M1.001 / M2 / FGSC 10212) TaxID=645133 RepID=E3QH45_COLGM|nr:uncharacterized protein GLRG_05351 [Colletotrichum graminicola M1.001]EFQ30207.1 hypothetical protein GLRG_05351 [Colletotrichum graminicola M1.001]